MAKKPVRRARKSAAVPSVTEAKKLLRTALRHEAKRKAENGGMSLSMVYEAARRNRSGTMNWLSSATGSNNSTLLPDLPALRERSRDSYRNSPLARGAVNNGVTSIVGAGLQGRPRVDWEFLGMSEEQGIEFNKAAKREFDAWAYSQEADYGRTLTFDGMQEVALRGVLVDGDHFAALRYKQRPGSPYGLKIQLIEAERCCNENNGNDTALRRAGIQLDEEGVVTGYWFAHHNPYDNSPFTKDRKWTLVPAFGTNSGMRQVLHLFRPMAANVLRGEPYLAPVLEPLRLLKKYSDAELVAAVVNSCFAVVTKTEAGDGVDLAAVSSTTTDSKKDPIVLAQEGTIVDLMPNEDIKGFTPERPNSGFDGFFMAMLKQIGVALEQPVEVLIKAFGQSYSASRAAFLQFWEFVRSRRDWLAWAFCQPIYEAFIIEAVASNRLRAPGLLRSLNDPVIRNAWMNCEWYGPAAPQLDPTKEVEAQKAAVDAGFTTNQRATVELNGGDWESNQIQLGREKAVRDEEGLTPPPPTALPGAKPGALPAPQDGETEARGLTVNVAPPDVNVSIMPTSNVTNEAPPPAPIVPAPPPHAESVEVTEWTGDGRIKTFIKRPILEN